MYTVDSVKILAGIPDSLREPLLKAFGSIVRNYRERRWEPAELNGGKLCEIVYTILQGHVTSHFLSKPTKPKNMVDACKDFEKVDDKKFTRSVRIQIPRMLIALYEIRNNRGVGHVGGDVEPNHMDSLQVLEMSKWIMAELVRIFHTTTPEEAKSAVEEIIDRTLYTVWEIAGQKRDLNSAHTMKEATLVLLYSQPDSTPVGELFKWVEHSNMANYKRDVIKPLHRERLIEFDNNSGLVYISPLGIRYIEEKISLVI